MTKTKAPTTAKRQRNRLAWQHDYALLLERHKYHTPAESVRFRDLAKKLGKSKATVARDCAVRDKYTKLFYEERYPDKMARVSALRAAHPDLLTLI